MKWFVTATTIFVAATPTLAEKKMLFWNETAHTMSGVYLAPMGTDAFGPNQTANDDNGTVESDERLPITGVNPGRYDVKLVDTRGRTCVARNIEVSGTGKVAFAIGEKQLDDCR